MMHPDGAGHLAVHVDAENMDIVSVIVIVGQALFETDRNHAFTNIGRVAQAERMFEFFSSFQTTIESCQEIDQTLENEIAPTDDTELMERPLNHTGSYLTKF